MPPKLLIEAKGTDQDEWSAAGMIRPGELEGSVSDNLEDGSRRMYLFGINLAERVAYLKESIAGLDSETSPLVRTVTPLSGYKTVAEIHDGEKHELEVVTDRGSRVLIRLSYFDQD